MTTAERLRRRGGPCYPSGEAVKVPTEWLEKAPRLKAIADWINANTTMVATIERTSVSTDRSIPGTRLRHPGKGRTGNLLKVYQCEEHRLELGRNPWHHFRREDDERERSRKYPHLPLIDHNAAETYRSNDEVVRKLFAILAKRNSVDDATEVKL